MVESITVNSRKYNDGAYNVTTNPGGLDDGGHIEKQQSGLAINMFQMLFDVLVEATNLFRTTSNSNHIIASSGQKIFAIDGVERNFFIGADIKIVNDANNWMAGTINSYDSVNQLVTIDLYTSAGSGTYTIWTLFSTGVQGVQGSTTLAGNMTGNIDVNGFSFVGTTNLELLKFIETAAAINELTITNAAAGNAPILSATGGDLNIDLILAPKGTGSVNLQDKTLQNAKLQDYSEEVTAPSSAAGILTLDMTNGNVFEVTLSENVATINVNNPPAIGSVGSFTLILKQDATGGRTFAFPTGTIWTGGTIPTLTTTANAIDELVFETTDGGTIWRSWLVGADMK